MLPSTQNGIPGTVTVPAWRGLRDACRAWCRGPRGQYDLRAYWRGRALAETAEALPVLRRAHAFAGVLDHVPLHLYPGERIVGSRAGFTSAVLPPGISAAEYGRAVEACRDAGQRDFQAGFDHAVPDYPTLLRLGISGLLAHAEAAHAARTDPAERAFLEAVGVCLRALAAFARRYSLRAAEGSNPDAAACLAALVSGPPRTFRQALQLLWLVHIAFVSEGRCHMALGRIDQVLLPFFRRDLRQDRLTREDALDLLCHLWAHIEELGEVTNLCVGGLTPGGRDATNDLTYLCIEATRRVQSPHTNLSARFHDRSPAALHRACFECIRTGVGFPALFNDEVLVPGLVQAGVQKSVARDYCLVGCIETHFAGRQQAWGDGVPGFAGESNMQCLERALRRLRPLKERTYAALVALFREELRRFFGECAARVNAHVARFPPTDYPDPFLSALTRDCIARVRDINDGGAAFARFYKCAGGENLATLADSMAAVGKLVFEDHLVDYDELIDALDADFRGFEPLRQMLRNRAPKYGNGDPYVDTIAAEMLDLILDEVEALPPLRDGGRFVACAAGNIHNIVRGRHVGATPDGRRAGEPLSDATSPHFGRDRNGPTAIFRSMRRTASRRVLGGRVANLKFEPEHFTGEEGVRRFEALTRAFVAGRIQELQFNFTGNETLIQAQKHPEEYRNLVVRVSGFSAYFTQLRPEVQNDVIRRRAHG
ncbi:MAG: hypothetical protein JXR77_12295 [Lentisphaeria bacterium]|nr:hypothetical protein [Lentisphaeria bacterium]